MRNMKIFRVEKLIIEPTERQTVHDIKAIINKTQDLKVISIGQPEDEAKGFLFKVKRELEWYPDTIK